MQPRPINLSFLLAQLSLHFTVVSNIMTIYSMLRRNLKPVFATILLAFCIHPETQAATSVTRGQITWYFSSDVQTGTYANGDPWVLGPVTISSISPKPTTNGRYMNGSMLNPTITSTHGLDSNISYLDYDGALNVGTKLPLSLKAGDMLLSSKSNATDEGAGWLEQIQILTVVSSAPAAGTFRPPYIGRTGKTSWNAANIDYAKLHSLAMPAGGANVPNLARLESNFQYPWIYVNNGAGNLHFRARLNHPWRDDTRASANYGRELSHMGAEALLSLQLNYTNKQKEKLAISLIQIGIDVYGAAKYAGANFYADGGHNIGHKLPVLLAGTLLNDSDLLLIGAGHKFQEDQQTFYVDATTVSITNGSSWAPDSRDVSDGAVTPYTSGDIGMPEWGIRHSSTPTADNKHWDAKYRHVAGPAMVGHALAAQLMGLKEEWNWPAFFDYADRMYGLQKSQASGGVNSIQLFVRDMWESYRKTAPPSGTATLSPPLPPSSPRAVQQ